MLALKSTAMRCDCLLARVTRLGPGASWKQGWGSIKMRATAGRMPLLVTDMLRLPFLPCTLEWMLC